MFRYRLLPVCGAFLLTMPFHVLAQAVPHPPVITAITPGGVGYVDYTSGTGGVSARIGRWDTAYDGGQNGPPMPGVEPLGDSTLTIDVDVNDGGTVSFDYALKTWDGGIWDWFDIALETPTGTIKLVDHLGKPGNDYGTYFDSPRVPLSQALDHWRNQHVRFVFTVVQDGWGDQSQGEISGFAIRNCKVTPLTPLTDAPAQSFENGATVDTEHLQPDMRAALDCVESEVEAANGRVNVASAYRPSAYQAHLREVWDKWRLLKDLRDPECQALREQVRAEFVRHQLLPSQRPAAPNGRHTTGEAIDMGSTLPLARFLSITAQCGLVRPLPANDPVHFVHQ